MPGRVPLVFFERLATWARRVRPRVVNWPVWVVETRSADDLAAALRSSPCPLVVADLASDPAQALDALARVLPGVPDALVLVLDPGRNDGVAAFCRELGASVVLSGPTTPPEVVAVLARWVPIAQGRGSKAGWAPEGQRPRFGEPGWDPMDLIS